MAAAAARRRGADRHRRHQGRRAGQGRRLLHHHGRRRAAGPAGDAVAPQRRRPGDVVLVSGPIGDHGITIMLARGELDIEADIVSDTAPLHELIAALLDAVPDGVRLPARRHPRAAWRRSATRSRVASQVAVVLDERAVPVRPEVNGASRAPRDRPAVRGVRGPAGGGRRRGPADDALAALRSLPARGGRRADRDGARRPARPGAAAHVVRRHPDRGPARRRSAAPDLLSGHLLMHELAITESIVAAVVERMPDTPVRRVHLLDRAAVRGGARRRPVLLRPGDGGHDPGRRGAGDRRAPRAGGVPGRAAPSSTRTRCWRCARAAARTSSCCAGGSCGSDRWRWRPDVRDVRVRGRGGRSSGPGTTTGTGTPTTRHAERADGSAGDRRAGQERRAGGGQPGVVRAAGDRRAEPDELARRGQDDAAGADRPRAGPAGVRAGGRPGDGARRRPDRRGGRPRRADQHRRRLPPGRGDGGAGAAGSRSRGRVGGVRGERRQPRVPGAVRPRRARPAW